MITCGCRCRTWIKRSTTCSWGMDDLPRSIFTNSPNNATADALITIQMNSDVQISFYQIFSENSGNILNDLLRPSITSSLRQHFTEWSAAGRCRTRSSARRPPFQTFAARPQSLPRWHGGAMLYLVEGHCTSFFHHMQHEEQECQHIVLRFPALSFHQIHSGS